MTKEYTCIKFTDFSYVRLKGLIWAFNGLIKGKNLDISAADELNRIYNECNDTFLIDCKGVVNITDHAWDAFFQSVAALRKEVIFVNATQLEDRINSSYREFCSPAGLRMIRSENSISIQMGLQTKPYDEYLKIVNSKITSKIRTGVIQCFEKNENNSYQFLPSTPIMCTGQFNASGIISDPGLFYWTCIRMADIVEELIKQHRIGGNRHTICLLAVNLRSCPLACAISLLLDIQLETIDHFGPVTGILDMGRRTYSKPYDYIYIGDFISGGTEFKISQTYALVKQSRCNYAVVIGSLHENAVYSGFTLNSTVTLKNIDPMVKFKLFENE